jgi:outer membrane lipoprotein-sorting protein
MMRCALPTRCFCHLALAAVVVAAGCSADPRAVLDATAKAYRQATAYADDARVRVVTTRGDVQTEHTIPFRVAFARPDKIRIDCYDARIVADGTTLFAAVGNVPGQVLAEAVKSPLSMDQLFTDDQVRGALAEGEAGCPTQLPLLLADDTVDLILADAVSRPRIAGTEAIDGHPCTRIDVAKPDGLLSLWIDRRSHVLRRLSLPTNAYAALLSQQAGATTGVSVVIDFVNASLGATIPADAFTFAVPTSAARVARLEPPAVPQPPSGLIGKTAPPFTLAGVDGKTVSREGITGEIVVLEFFFVECRPSKKTMPQVARAVAAGRAAGIDIRHFAVSVDEADVADDALIAKVKECGGSGTIVRDPRGVAAEAFGIGVIPTAVVVAKDGTVADIVAGDDAQIGSDVTAVLTALAAGQATTGLVRERFETRLRDYQRVIEKVAGTDAVAPLPEQVIAPRKQPVRFKVARAWRADGVAMPGNLVCVADPGADGGQSAPRIVCLDGWRSVVVLDADGQDVARHELALPAGAAIGYLRTAVDGDGKRWWLGGARGGQQVFLFDDHWKLRTVYPPVGGPPHDGIADSVLVDCTGDGTPEIVAGYLGTAGVQCADLDGTRLWRARSLQGVVSVAGRGAAAATSGLACVDGIGRYMPVACAGAVGEAVPLAASESGAGPLVLRSVVGGPVAMDGAWALIGMAGATLGKNTAVGLTADGAVAWTLPLADGMHREGAIDPVAWADLLGSARNQWLIAAPDGSVTVAWADGGVVDRYCHGRPLVGIGGYRTPHGGHIVLATPEGVESLRMEDIALD